MDLPQPPLNTPMYDKPGLIGQMWRFFFQSIYDMSGASYFNARSSDPGVPDRGQAVIWLSDGTGTGDNGDIMATITDTNGTTKTTTLVDFSAV